jgi:hypothetical protein
MSQAPHRHLAAILDGQPSPESGGCLASAGLRRCPVPFSGEELLDAVLWWLTESAADDPRAILRRLGLPGTRRRALNNLRDRQLIAAAHLIAPDTGTHAQAVALREACRAYGGHKWPCWRNLNEPPAHATPAAQVLFWAFRYDAGNAREGQPHTPADWSLSAFRKLLD